MTTVTPTEAAWNDLESVVKQLTDYDADTMKAFNELKEQGERKRQKQGIAGPIKGSGQAPMQITQIRRVSDLIISVLEARAKIVQKVVDKCR